MYIFFRVNTVHGQVAFVGGKLASNGSLIYLLNATISRYKRNKRIRAERLTVYFIDVFLVLKGKSKKSHRR